MAFAHYTRCVEPRNYSGPVNIKGGLVAAGIAGLVTLNVGFATVAAVIAGIAFCRWWLYGRLVCLGGQRCAIGLALEVFPPEDKTGLDREDTDYSVNLLLAPTTLWEGMNQAGQDAQGELLRLSSDPAFTTMLQNFASISNGVGLGFTGEPEPFSGLINPEGMARGAVTWQPNTVYNPGSAIQDPNGNFQTCNDTGPSGTSQPSWATTLGQTTQDGIITWTMTGHYSVLTQAGLLSLGIVDPGDWSAGAQYKVGDLVLVSNPASGGAAASQTQSIQACIAAGASGAAPPTWPMTFGEATPEMGSTLVWSCLGVGGRWSHSYLDSTSYNASITVYQQDDLIIDGNGALQRCAQTGQSGSIAPDWKTGLGETTLDGQTQWTREPNLGWSPGTAFLVGTQITDTLGAAQTCTGAGTSGAVEPAWSAANGAATFDTGPSPTPVWTRAGQSINAIGTLEVEFEGGGMYDLYQALLAALPLALAAAAAGVAIFAGIMGPAAAAAAAAAATGPWGWLLALLILLVALIVAAVAQALASAPAVAVAAGGYYAGQADVANPAADDPNLGTIFPGQDVLVVMGDWIYDSAHSGWNELHPVLHCQKIARVASPDLAAGDPWVNLPQFSAANVETTLHQHTGDRMGWCPLIDEARHPATRASQQAPQNGWVLHPLVDGCTPPPPPPPPLQ